MPKWNLKNFRQKKNGHEQDMLPQQKADMHQAGVDSSDIAPPRLSYIVSALLGVVYKY
jgi:hypothetical protein